MPLYQTVCVDFDGVIHAYTSPWTTAEEISDGPVEGSIPWLVNMTQHYIVAVFSTRCHQEGGKDAIRRWLLENGVSAEILMRLKFPKEKPPAVLYIDDRAWAFTGNGSLPSPREVDEFKPWNKL